jgi:hypothetical protein
LIKEVAAMRKYLFYLALLLAGCGSDGDGFTSPEPLPAESASPEISDLTVSPASVIHMEGDGLVSATAELSYRDDDRDIATLRIEMSDGNDQQIPLDNIDAVSGTLSEEISVSTAELGTLTAEFWLVDAAGNTSNRLSADFLVQNPVPRLVSLDPAGTLIGSEGFNLVVTGTGFLEGATVTWDGASRQTAYVSDTELIASIPSSLLESPGVVNVAVRNPDPTAGPSNELRFEVVSPHATGFPLLITETIDGLPPNGPIVNGGLDWDGGFVSFASRASNLVAGDTNNACDLFIRDTCLRYVPDHDCVPETIRIVLAAGGAEPNGDIGWTDTSPEGSLAVSFNGRYVAFVSSASNLVPDDTNGVDDVFLVDNCIEPSYPRLACTPGVIRVSVRDDGSQSPVPASYPAVADDGRYVLFVSADPNLVAGDTNGVADVFLRDTCRNASTQCTPSTVRVSVANNGGQANGPSSEPSFTGRYVAFSSLASNLVAADPNGVQDVFLRDTCLGESQCGPSTRLVSVGRLGDPADGASSEPQVTWGLSDYSGHDHHGRHVAFVSAASNLVADDTNGANDVFVRDFCFDEPGCMPSTARASLTATGGQIPGDSWSPDFLSWDGESVAFVSDADGIVPGDANGLADVFKVRICPAGAPDYCSEGTERVSVGADGAQTDGNSYGPRMSHHFYGPWLATYISEASNILADDVVVIPNYGNIYMALN